MAITDDNAFELPRLRSSFTLENDTEFLENDNCAEFFDVKFCPYQPLDAPPVFAAISKKHAFHDTGRYLLSAAHDQIINLTKWTLPDLPTEAIQTPARVHYPHFSTSAVHSGIIDCVAFYGDCILSRACHDNVISLWRIEGFSSANPPPAESEAPTAQTTVPTNYEEASRLTRSAFVPTISPQCPSQYTMLLQFYTPNCGPQFFMRFKLHFVPDQHPVLAFCNAAGNVFFWDFERLVAYREFMEALKDPGRDKSKQLPHPSWMRQVKTRSKTDSKGRQGGGDKDVPSTFRADAIRLSEEIGDYNVETLETWASRYSQDDPHEPLKAHKTESSSANFVGRQTAWSPGGEWCVVVGSSNQALILQRWANKGSTSRASASASASASVPPSVSAQNGAV
ncbi:unnamed protein product [Fusarium graminearum]|nr:unnamed protein product [Fusarium graminearum]CAG2004210.1 unnamed protein product [Fusarium graminearum]VTO87521.1 unnamed protein product [Fusarium graminearum]